MGYFLFSKKWFSVRFFLVIVSVSIAMALFLPSVYIFLRALGSERSLVEYLLRPSVGKVLVNTLVLAGVVTALALTIGTSLAFLFTKTNLVGKRVWLPLSLFPLVLPSYLSAFALIGAVGARGWVQKILQPLGVERLPSVYGFWGAVLVLTVFTYPYVLLSVRSALLGLDNRLEEAARNLGKNSGQVFWSITFPALKPALSMGGLLSALYVISDFGAVAMLQYNTITRAIYMQYRAMFDRSGAAILSLLLIGITLLFLWWQHHSAIQGKRAQQRFSQPQNNNPIHLGQYQIPAQILCFVIIGGALLLPTITLLYWLFLGISLGTQLPSLPIGNSLVIAGVSAFMACVLALPIAIVLVRYPGKFSIWLEKIVYAGHGLPGIVIALALVFVSARWLPLVYQGFGVLVFAYLVRFLPQSLGALKNTLQQINPNLEESARSLGKSRWTVLREIILPLLRPGWWHGFTLVFLAVMRELPVTLLLAPSGFSTFATMIWHASEEALYTQAAWPGLWLMIFSIGFMPVILQNLTHRRIS